MKIKGYLLIILIVVSAVGLSVCSYIYTPAKYQEYSVGVDKEPVMAPMLKGVTAGVFPWTPVEESEDSKPEKQQAKDEEKQPEAKIEVVEPKSYTKVEDDYFDDAVFMFGLRVETQAERGRVASATRGCSAL